MHMPRETGTFHIIGIGGIGMSAIAEVLAAKGFRVQGSDQRDGPNVQRLNGKGIKVFIGHSAENLDGAAYAVISTAVKDANPELAAARERGMPVIRRAEILAELMRLNSTVSITGTHGKTTTTSLAGHIFAEAGQDPTVVTGGIVNDWGSNARTGEGRWMIVEADESDGTFSRLPTEIGVVTNVDPEHLDYFGSVENMHREFETFFRNIPFYGLAVACADHPVVRDLIARASLRHDGRRLLTYGASEDADLRLTGLRFEGRTTCFSAELSPRVPGGARRIDDWCIPIPGEHNVLNTLAAIAVAAEAGIPDEAIRKALATFSGVRRRFQHTGSWNGVSVFDDYGHHPAEIAAVLKAARAGARARVIAVVEPHRYTRVRDLFQDFSECFAEADSVLVAPLYSAGEAPIDGVTHRTLADGIRATGHGCVLALESPDDIAPAVRRMARPGDIVICLGAGNSTDWAQALPDQLNLEPVRAAGAM